MKHILFKPILTSSLSTFCDVPLGVWLPTTGLGRRNRLPRCSFGTAGDDCEGTGSSSSGSSGTPSSDLSDFEGWRNASSLECRFGLVFGLLLDGIGRSSWDSSLESRRYFLLLGRFGRSSSDSLRSSKGSKLYVGKRRQRMLLKILGVLVSDVPAARKAEVFSPLYKQILHLLLHNLRNFFQNVLAF